MSLFTSIDDFHCFHSRDFFIPYSNMLGIVRCNILLYTVRMVCIFLITTFPKLFRFDQHVQNAKELNNCRRIFIDKFSNWKNQKSSCLELHKTWKKHVMKCYVVEQMAEDREEVERNFRLSVCELQQAISIDRGDLQNQAKTELNAVFQVCCLFLIDQAVLRHRLQM